MLILFVCIQDWPTKHQLKAGWIIPPTSMQAQHEAFDLLLNIRLLDNVIKLAVEG
jgi:hypothetical protein